MASKLAKIIAGTVFGVGILSGAAGLNYHNKIAYSIGALETVGGGLALIAFCTNSSKKKDYSKK